MNQLTPAQMNTLLQYASQKLGVSPQTLAASAADGGYDGLVNSLSEDRRRQLEALIGNPAQMQALLNSEQVRQLLQRFSK